MPELDLVDALTRAGHSNHGARLGKVHAELGVQACDGVRAIGYGEKRHVVEYTIEP